MRARILDTLTGKLRIVDGPRSYEWAKGNWSCDCNRAEEPFDSPVCIGAHRYIVVDRQINDPGDEDCYTLEELNADYPPELVAKAIAAYEGFGVTAYEGFGVPDHN